MSPSNTNTEIALIKNDISYMKWDIQDIKKILKEFIDSAPDKFATKDELVPIKEKQVEHDKIIERIAWWSVWTLITIILWVIWVTKFM